MRTRADLRRRRRALASVWDRHVGAQHSDDRGSERPDEVRSEIFSSWDRSAKHVSLGVAEAPLAELEDTAETWEHSPLNGAVRRLEAELRSAADDADLVVAVTDPNARILWTYSSHAMRGRAKKVNFVAGGMWNEQSVGTNALDLALRLDTAATVYSAEHYSSCVHDWVCWAVPVHEPEGGRQLGVLDLSTTWDRAHPIGLAAVGALGGLVEHEVFAGRAESATRSSCEPGTPAGTGRAVLEIWLLGQARVQLNGIDLKLTRRQTEIVALLALRPDGLGLGELHAQLYGDRPVSTGTLKAELSHLRAALGGRLASRPYRIDVPIWCDVNDLVGRLRDGDVMAAADLYGGELLGWSDSPELTDYREFVTVALRTALLADPQRQAALRYAQRAPHDLEPLATAWA
jgi:hypothetical protein